MDSTSDVVASEHEPQDNFNCDFLPPAWVDDQLNQSNQTMKTFGDLLEDASTIDSSDDDVSITFEGEVRTVIDIETEDDDVQEVTADYRVENVAQATSKDNCDDQQINLQVPCPTEADLSSAGASRSDDNNNGNDNTDEARCSTTPQDTSANVLPERPVGIKRKSKNLNQSGEESGKLFKKRIGRPPKLAFDWVSRDNLTKINCPSEHNWIKMPYPHNDLYLPQLNDKVFYLKDAHEFYLNKSDDSEDLIPTEDHCLSATVEDIQFELNDQQTVALIKLTTVLLDDDFSPCQFQVRYCNSDKAVGMSFLILQEVYLNSIKINFKPKDRFKSLVNRSWWYGEVIEKSPSNEEYPESNYLCYVIKWDSESQNTDRLSPWNMVKVSPENDPIFKTTGTVAKISSAISFQNYNFEIENNWDDNECQRIFTGISKIINTFHLQDLEIFNKKQQFDKTIPYPIDLTLIMNRLNYSYYRRREAFVFDIRFIKEIILERFEVKKKQIEVNFLRLVLLFSRSLKYKDPFDLFNSNEEAKKIISVFKYYKQKPQTGAKRQKIDDQKETDVERVSESTDEPSMEKVRKIYGEIEGHVNDIYKRMGEFVLELMRKPDYEPFVNFVSREEFPTYYNVITEPMCLNEIKKKLDEHIYVNAKDVRSDLRKIVENAKIFNTNSKSIIRRRAKEFSSTVEERMRGIISSWDSVEAYVQKRITGAPTSSRSKPLSVDSIWRLRGTSHIV